MADMAINHPNKGNMNLSHCLKGTSAMPNIAINIPEVGMMVFAKPSPQVKAKMAVCRVMPSKSANGAISGIVVAACPDPEGMKKFKKD